MRPFEEGFFAGLSKMERLYKRYVQEAVVEYQFTPNEIAVLMFLYNNAPSLDTASDIARYKRISKGLVARSVDSLLRRGLICARRDEGDRRIVHLALNAGCQDVLARLRASEERMVTRAAEGIEPQRLADALDVLRQIDANMSRLLQGEEDEV